MSVTQVISKSEHSSIAGLAPAAGKLHLDYLDGIRALAALFVLCCHAGGIAFQISRLPNPGRGWSFFTNYAHLPVDVFIVLSGFCLGLPIAKHLRLVDGAAAFFRRRARRILPPYYASLAVSILVLAGSPHVRAHYLHPNIAYIKMFLINALLLQDVFPGYNMLNAPYWSVAVEWKIYFLFPLIVAIGLRWGWKAALGFSVAIAFAVTEMLHLLMPSLVLDHTCPWYLVLFATGVYASQVAQGHGAKSADGKNTVILLMLSAIVSTVLLWIMPLPVDVSAAVYASYEPYFDCAFGISIACALVVLSINRDKNVMFIRNLLAARPLVFLGRYSYSIYLLHIPLMMSAMTYIAFRYSGHTMAAMPVPAKFAFMMLIELPLFLLITYLFFFIFERPYLQSRKSDGAAEVSREPIPLPAP